MEIPLTSFIDFVTKSGSPKMTCARNIKVQLGEPYDPATDYYKRFREAVQELHKRGLPKGELPKLIGSLPETKQVNYQAMVTGYKKFLGTKDVEWFEPQRKNWKHGKVTVPVNPEIGLKWGDKKYVIKLYLKSNVLTKDRIASVLALMNETLVTKDIVLAILDVRNAKLHEFEKNMKALMILVEGEAESLELMLDRL